MNLILEREPPHADCTLGVLVVGDTALSTIERPWVPGVDLGGVKGVSCVPKGTYRLVRHDTEAHPRTWALVNEALNVYHLPGPAVPATARTAVLIHPANFVHELRGCIAPGTRTGRDGEGRYMVQESRKAMEMIQHRVSWTDEHTLVIK